LLFVRIVWASERFLLFDKPRFNPSFQMRLAMLRTVLLVLLILMLVGAIPTWPHSRDWGYGPSGGLGLVLIIFLILILTGRW
jgi:hypothetical protein